MIAGQGLVLASDDHSPEFLCGDPNASAYRPAQNRCRVERIGRVRFESRGWRSWRIRVMGGHEDAAGNLSRARDHMANERTYLAWLRAPR